MGPRDEPPFAIDALVREEDTFLVLSGEPDPRGPGSEHPIRVMTALLDVEPQPPGTVLVRERVPLEMLAVVHDLSEDPTWREDWIAEAIRGVLAEAEARGLHLIGMEMLGTVHGRLERPRFIQILRGVLRQVKPRSLERVWLIAPE